VALLRHFSSIERGDFFLIESVRIEATELTLLVDVLGVPGDSRKRLFVAFRLLPDELMVGFASNSIE
jgi:hypothetical protein